MNNKCLIQGYQGSFHEAAMRSFFGENACQAIPCDSFDILARSLDNQDAPLAMMAIENSIAGSILQNYRILREHQLEIIGEQYLQINHQLMALPGQTLNDIHTVLSHPMAINQCLDFLNKYPQIDRKEYSDTALAAKKISDNRIKGVAAIASELASDIYELDVIGEDIQTVNSNYTRFFAVQKNKNNSDPNADKASIYIKLKHQRGSLLEVLKIVNDKNLNLSKLQSFPVLGKLHEYYFYLDFEFEVLDNYLNAMQELKTICIDCEEMGLYKKANIPNVTPASILA